MEKFLKAIDRINEQTGKAVSYLVIILTAVVLYEIFVRYLFNSPTIWAHEISQMIYGAYVILLGGYVLQRKGHVNVDILYAGFSPRTKAGVNVFTWLIFFLWCGVLVWTGWIRGWDSLMIGERESTAFACPIYPVKLSLAIGGFLLFLQGVAVYARSLYTLITGAKID